MTADKQIQDLLKTLTPDQQSFAKAVTLMQIENKTLHQQLADLNNQHDDLWKVMIVLLDVQPKKELRIHESQFKRFKEEYRIDRTWDEETKEIVMRLLTVFDDPA